MTPNIDINQLFRVGVYIVIGGILLLAFTYLVEFLLPLIVFGVLAFVAYVIYTYFKTGTVKL